MSQSNSKSTDTDRNAAFQGLPGEWQSVHEARLAAMIEIAVAAGQHTLRYFGATSLQVDRKGDDSPVTVADREAEQLVRDLVAQRFPDDTIAGEEYAEQTGTSPFRWTVDPIDGTKSFICGVPLYSTLLAVEHKGEPLGGVILLPGLGKAVIASMGLGCFQSDDYRSWTPAQVSRQDSLSRAVFVTSEVASFAERGDADAFGRLQDACWLTRTWGDGYGYAMVATGRADVMVDPICNAWDVAAIAPILKEAGGKFTDWKNVETVRGGDGVGTNGMLHDDVISKLK